MITAQDIQTIAYNMAERHGIVALEYADSAIHEMEAIGDSYRTECWVALKEALKDVLVLIESGSAEQMSAPVIH